MPTKSKPHAEESPKAIFLNAIKVSLMLRACESFDFGSKLYHIWRVHSGSANYILWPECHDD